MKKKWIITGVIAIIVVFIGVNIWNDQAATKAVTVETAVLEEGSMTESVMTPGILQLDHEQFVYHQADKGEIEDIHVKEGDTVEEGDQLLSYKNKQLELDKEQNQLQINAIYIDLDKLKKERANIDEKVEQNSGDEMLQDEQGQIKQQQQQANNELDQALLQKESIEDEIDDLTVKADVDGSVLSVDEEAGAKGEMGEDAILRIGSLDQLHVTGGISEYDTMNIEAGQSVELTSDAVPDKSWKGEVSYISDLPEEETQDFGEQETSVDYPIEVTLDDEIDLKPGFQMLLEVITSEQEVSTLPINSVIQEDEVNYVYVVEDGSAKRVEVEVGTVDTEQMEIEEGVTKEDQVIINPSDNITDGTEVNIE